MAVGSFSAGLSGLNANSVYLSVIGNNLSNGIPNIQFTSATCGNDVLTNTPEPASLGMIGLGLLAAGWRVRKSRNQK